MAHVKAHTRKIKVRSKRARGRKGKSYKYVRVKGHSRKK